MFKKAFWLAAGERAVKTTSQAILALFAADAALTTFNVDWNQVLAISTTAGFISVLTSLVSYERGPFAGPSLTTEAIVSSTQPDS